MAITHGTGPRVPRTSSLIVALHRDAGQWTALRHALNDRVDADIIVADSIGAALYVIDARPPDLILVDPLIPPREADDLTGYLALLPEASHAQTISVPVISPFFDRGGSVEVASRQPWIRRRLFPSRSRLASTGVAWNPAAFAADVARYLSLSLAIRADKEQTDGARELLRAVERRQASRRTAEEASFVQPVFVMTDRADLIDISSTGLLVRTETRPNRRLLPTAPDRGPRNQSPLTLSSVSGDAIRRTGTPVRCRTKSLGGGRFLYEVAFRFDKPLDLELATLDGPRGHNHDSERRLAKT